jgi:hypothetical protein
MIKIKTPKTNQSSFAGFESERISIAELLNTLGGIEKGDDMDDITVKELTFEDIVFDPIIPVWNIKNTQSEPYFIRGEKNFLSKDNLFSPLRFFRTLLLYVCNGFKFKSKQ